MAWYLPPKKISKSRQLYRKLYSRYRKNIYWPCRNFGWNTLNNLYDYAASIYLFLSSFLLWVFFPVLMLVIALTNWYAHHIQHLDESYFERRGKKYIEQLKGGSR